MFIDRSVQTFALSLIFATAAAAQESNGNSGEPARSLNELARRSSFSIAAIQTRPQGALGRNIGLGYGGSGSYLLRLDAQGVWSIRADVAALVYGNESKQTPFSETVGGRVQVKTRTTNYIVPVSIGPQLAWPRGAVRPYINAGIGAQAFVTESAVGGTDNATVLATTTNQSDVVATWVAGGGIYIPLVRGTTRVQLDLGMQYLSGGRARYLAPGSIVNLEGGGVQISPFESTTHLFMLRAGARIGL